MGIDEPTLWSKSTMTLLAKQTTVAEVKRMLRHGLTRRTALAGLTAGMLPFALKADVQTKSPAISVEGFGVKRWPTYTSALAVKSAIESGVPLDWLGWKIRLDAPVAAIVTEDVIWQGRGAEIVYDGIRAAAAVKITTSKGARFRIDDITIDANSKCNIAMLFESTGSMAAASTVATRNLRTVRAKRSDHFEGVPGMGLYIQGSFDWIDLMGGGAHDCDLPTGTGIESVAGVCGIGVTFIDGERWVKRCTANGIDVTNIHSDGRYQFDQDGLAYFAPNDPGHPSGKKESHLLVTGSRFQNCFGRSIKTQCRTSEVSENVFVRTAGQFDGVGNMEIDVQAGTGKVFKNKFDYRNGQQPHFCARLACDLVRGVAGLIMADNEIYLDEHTVLGGLVQSFASNGNTATLLIEKNRIYGKTRMLLDFICSGPSNSARVIDNWVQQLLRRTDVTGDVAEAVAAVWVRKGGHPADAHVTISGNTHAGTGAPAMVQTQVPGSAMAAAIAARANSGFAIIH